MQKHVPPNDTGSSVLTTSTKFQHNIPKVQNTWHTEGKGIQF